MALTDRELLLEAQEQYHAEFQAVQAIEQAKVLGYAKAALVLAMLEGLAASGLMQREKMQLVEAALRGH